MVAVKVGLACYGDSQLPETVEELEPMLRSLKSKEPFPSWVFDVVKVLQEDETYSSDSMKIRESQLCVILLSSSHVGCNFHLFSPLLVAEVRKSNPHPSQLHRYR